MADPAMPNFQIPPEMQAFAEQGMKQARQTFDEFFSATQRALSNFEGQAAAVQAGAKDVQQRAAGCTERNMAASFDFAQKLLRASSPEAVMRLHADHLRGQIAILTEQARELARTATVR